MEKDAEIKILANKIIHSFTSNLRDESEKWSMLNIYHNKYLSKKDFDKTLIITYPAVLTALLDALQTTLFLEKWQEDLFDNMFLHGILHESFFKLVKRLEDRFVCLNFSIVMLLCLSPVMVILNLKSSLLRIYSILMSL